MVAVCDVNPETARTAAEKYHVGRTYTDYRELLADPAIDAVSVATPNKYHVQPTVDALRAGKHVLCEKPLGMNADECRQMCAAARESGKILQVALQMLQRPGPVPEGVHRRRRHGRYLLCPGAGPPAARRPAGACLSTRSSKEAGR